MLVGCESRASYINSFMSDPCRNSYKIETEVKDQVAALQ